MSDFTIGNVLIFVVIGVSILGVMLMIGFLVFSSRENKFELKMQDMYEKINKEFVSGDQAVQQLTDSKIEKTNASIMNIAESVQAIENKGGETVISGDLCINNTCFSSSSNEKSRINLDELTGLTSKFLTNLAGVDPAATTADLQNLKTEVQNKIKASS